MKKINVKIDEGTLFRAKKVLLVIPLVIAPACLVIISYLLVLRFYPSMWNEIIAMFAFPVVFYLLLAREDNLNVIEFNLKIVQVVFLGLVVVILGIVLTDKYNTDKEPLGSTLRLIDFILKTIIVLFMGKKIYKTSYFLEMAALILQGFLFIAFQKIAFELFLNFGTQFIWVPVMSFLFLYVLIYVHGDTSILENEKNDKILKISVFSFGPVIALISTIYEFWYVSIFNYLLWEILACFLVLGIFIVFVVLLIRHNQKRKRRLFLIEQEKKQYIKNEEQKEQKYKEKQLNLKMLEEYKGRNKFSWKEVLNLTSFFDNDVREFPVLYDCIPYAPLIELVVVSNVKKQIVFDDRLITALNMSDSIFKKIFEDDTLLSSYRRMIDDFLLKVSGLENYLGYEELKKTLEKNCPEIMKHVLLVK
jgi:hypothetical protein